MLTQRSNTSSRSYSPDFYPYPELSLIYSKICFRSGLINSGYLKARSIIEILIVLCLRPNITTREVLQIMIPDIDTSSPSFLHPTFIVKQCTQHNFWIKKEVNSIRTIRETATLINYIHSNEFSLEEKILCFIMLCYEFPEFSEIENKLSINTFYYDKIKQAFQTKYGFTPELVFQLTQFYAPKISIMNRFDYIETNEEYELLGLDESEDDSSVDSIADLSNYDPGQDFFLSSNILSTPWLITPDIFENGTEDKPGKKKRCYSSFFTKTSFESIDSVSSKDEENQRTAPSYKKSS